MCGIAGVYGQFSLDKRREVLRQLSDDLSHRGPDGSRMYEDEFIGMVHTRLSIIDLSDAGNQPLYNEDRSLVLVCNGEIYNYKSLRQELVAKGHQFSSHSDSEVILHLYEDHHKDPEQMLNRLTGMFAFVLWDIKKSQLFIARDRVGIKPMYYSRKGDSFIFGSEVRPIVNCGLVDSSIDYTSVYEYFLTGSIPGPNTLYNEVKSLEPGYYAIVRDSRMAIKQYWDIPLGDTSRFRTEEAALAATEDLLKTVVSDHLVADVPVGTFLSAGVDSSLITSVAVEAHPGIHSFTASFPGEPEDEGAVAAASARKMGTTHHFSETSNSFFDVLDYQFAHIDQPFAISSALSLGRISRMASQHVKVVLSGDGADELFGGYYRHQQPVRPGFLKYIPASMQDQVLRIGARILRNGNIEQLRKNLKIPPEKTFFERVIVMPPEVAISYMNPDILKKVDQHRYFNRLKFFFDRSAGADALSRILYTDMKTTLVDEMLTKCDRMTMRNGIEGRVPFLDHRMVELAFSIPTAYKRQGGIGKMPLRKILARRLGDDLAFRKKTGFNAPLQQWLQKDPATYGHAQSVMHNLADIPFLNHHKTQKSIDSVKEADGTEILELVCLSHFFGHANTH